MKLLVRNDKIRLRKLFLDNYINNINCWKFCTTNLARNSVNDDWNWEQNIKSYLFFIKLLKSGCEFVLLRDFYKDLIQR